METNEIIKLAPNKKLDCNNINVVLYHSKCFDGFACAFIVWYYYKHNFGIEAANNILYIPCMCQNELAEEFINKFVNKFAGKNILMCDFSYNYEQLLKLMNVSNSFMILDHHKTAEAELRNVPNHLKIFDMKKSGCGITWEYFFPNHIMPLFLKHIQDRDIWTYIVPNTLEFVTYFYQQNFDFELWETYIDGIKVNEAVEIGKKWLGYQKEIIDKIIDSCAFEIVHEINNQRAIVAYCNAPYYKSDIGNKLFNKFPNADFSCVWDYDLYRNQTLFSLRSTDERMDVSAIAKKIGGGGHRNASGVMIPGINGKLPFPIVSDITLNPSEKNIDDMPSNLSIKNDYEEPEKSNIPMNYHQLIMNDIAAKTSYVLHEINGIYAVGLYCNSCIFQYELAIEMLKQYPFGDFACVWNYDVQKNKTYWVVHSLNDNKIKLYQKMKSQFNSKTITYVTRNDQSHKQDIYEVMTTSNITGCLSFEKIDDMGILQLLSNATKENVLSSKDNPDPLSILKIKENKIYTLFKVREIKQEWIDQFLELLKRKYEDSMLLVFEKEILPTKLDLSNIDGNFIRSLQNPIPTKEYTIFYNEKSDTQSEKRFIMEILMPKDQALIFCSEKNFAEIFQDINIEKCDSDYTDSSDDQDQIDNHDEIDDHDEIDNYDEIDNHDETDDHNNWEKMISLIHRYTDSNINNEIDSEK